MAPSTTDEHVLRARRTAAITRSVSAAVAIALVVMHPTLTAHPQLCAVGFVAIFASATVQLYAPGMNWPLIEESIAGVAALFIIGLGQEKVTVLSMLWLTAIASGVLSRGGRVHSVGRVGVLLALGLPIIHTGTLSDSYLGLCCATIGLLLVCGRLTRELSHLLTQARHDIDHDDLTHLLSRYGFRACLDEMSESATPDHPVSLLLIDLNNFGEINKTRGHAAGDVLLALVGRRLSKHAGPDCAVGRLGGDEFAVLSTSDQPIDLAHALLGELEGNSDGISACVGIAQAPRDACNADGLLRAGDVALRVAKRSGEGGQISCYAGESLSSDGGRSAHYALARLIEGRGIATVVQPIVELDTGRVHAYEALSRFQAGTTQSPLHWFSLAEEFHQREALERACLRTSLELFAERPRGARMSVNLSAPVLLDPLTLAMLEQPRDLTGLIIEITEQALVQNDGRLEAVAAALQARGVSLAIDDMGAGYSGLRQITAVHPAYLKLDRSLVSGIDRDSDRAALISALVGYAEHVGSLLVAEGIETAQELRALIALGVPLGQGFFLARPEPPWPATQTFDVSQARGGVLQAV